MNREPYPPGASLQLVPLLLSTKHISFQTAWSFLYFNIKYFLNANIISETAIFNIAQAYAVEIFEYREIGILFKNAYYCTKFLSYEN